MNGNLVDAKEISLILSVPLRWVWMAAREGRIPHFRVGKYMRFDPKEVLGSLQSPNEGDLSHDSKASLASVPVHQWFQAN